MYATFAIQDGHEQQHPDKWPTIVCGGGTGCRGAAPTIKTGGVLWLTCWSVVCDLAEARKGACADGMDAEKERRLFK
ncbi:hypothetical protein DPMN_032386 [Dreissena polymorpha]|uniref:Uncharacterized protein n=1 Tax=Dreissena polymorpha TaxID=45954 RepID=A0A9D4M3U8_DREPO|nr:hypothetical protein DPMN_032386 [Dreissena polymorpha]